MGSHCNRLQTWPLRSWFLLEFVKWASDGKGSGSWLQNCLFCLEASDMGEWNGVEQPSNEFPNATTRVPCQMAQTTPSLVKRTKTCCKAARNFSAHDLVFNCKITLLSQVHVQTASHTYVIIYIYIHIHTCINTFTLPIHGTVQDAQRFLNMWKGMAPSKKIELEIVGVRQPKKSISWWRGRPNGAPSIAGAMNIL